MSRSQLIRECLAEGACTAHEVSAITGLAIRSTRVGIWVLTSSGHARRAGFCAPEGRLLALYELTLQGEEITAAMRMPGDAE